MSKRCDWCYKRHDGYCCNGGEDLCDDCAKFLVDWTLKKDDKEWIRTASKTLKKKRPGFYKKVQAKAKELDKKRTGFSLTVIRFK